MQYASPTQLYNHVSRLLTGGIVKTLPAWYSAMEKFPPRQNLLRDPLQSRKSKKRHWLSNTKSHSQKHLKTKVPRPPTIHYMEDRLRREFYRDHPYELWRPQILMENNDDIVEDNSES